MDQGRDGAVYARFRRALENQRLTAGALVTQGELCKALNVPVARLRRALVLLAAYGLVKIEPRIGVRIAYPDVAFIRETYQFLTMIEVAAIRVVLPQMDREWIGQMRGEHNALLANLSANPGNDIWTGDIMRLDNELHSTIVAALGNRAISRTHRLLRDNLGFAQQVHHSSFGTAQYLSSLNEHLGLLDAMESGDLSATIAALEAHFKTSTHRIFGGQH